MVNVQVLALQGEIDIGQRDWIERKLAEIESFGSNSMTILDLNEVRYADSTLVHAIAKVKKQVSNVHNRRAVCIVAPRHIAMLFEMTNLDREIPVFGDISSAHQFASSL